MNCKKALDPLVDFCIWCSAVVKWACIASTVAFVLRNQSSGRVVVVLIVWRIAIGRLFVVKRLWTFLWILDQVEKERMFSKLVTVLPADPLISNLHKIRPLFFNIFFSKKNRNGKDWLGAKHGAPAEFCKLRGQSIFSTRFARKCFQWAFCFAG